MPSQNKHGLLCLVVVVLCVCDVKAQIVSVKDGDWSSATTWNGGIVPNPDSQVTIFHNVTIPSGSTLSVSNVTVAGNGRLIVSASVEITVVNGALAGHISLVETGMLHINGTLICSHGASIIGSTSVNTIFFDGAVYRHAWQTEGAIPLATWYLNSTFEVVGLTASPTMHSVNWEQTFGNFIYNCPGQGGFVDFDGHLKNIANDFRITNTGSNVLKVSGGRNLALRVGGDVIVSGPSRVWFADTGTDNHLIVEGDFTYESSATAASYFATRGQTLIETMGNFTMNANKNLKFTSDSQGQTTLRLGGDLILESGMLEALGIGTGTIVFDGRGIQNFFRSDGLIDGNFNFIVETESTLDLGESLLANTTGGYFQLKGKILLGSTNPAGVIQAGSGGNINVFGALLFDPGAVLEFNGSGHQFIGHTDLVDAEVLINNGSVVTLLNNIKTGGLTLQDGNLDTGVYSCQVSQDVTLHNGTIAGAGTLLLNGLTEQSLSANGHTIHNIVIDKSGGSSVILTTPVLLTGLLSVLSGNSEVVSNGNLTLVSSSQETASVGILPSESSITGNVTVQRFMKAIGRKYRYISSPVANATVSSLMDDFPITGTFEDPSAGPGINSNSPSMFLYDETNGGLNDGWKPYPSTGNSNTNLLARGLGYSVFIREGTNPTIWDVTGILNQGDLILPVTYTFTNEPTADGWNLIGNPYPSSIRWDDESGWQRNTSVSMGIAVRDNAINGFRYWDGELGDVSDGRVALGQSFWVRATGPDPQLTIHETAKVTGSATFYRRRQPLDYIELEVKVDDQIDKTFLRLREGANDLLDNYDIPKLANDYLSLSFLTTDSISVAINAMEKIPCHLEIPLKISFKQWTAGGVSFTLNTFGLFSGSEFYLTQEGVNEIIKLDPKGSTVVLPEMITTLDGLRLVIDSPIPEEVQFNSPSIVCGQDSLKIQLQNAQPGISYSLMMENEVVPSVFNRQTGSLLIPGEELAEGRHSIQLIASSSCATRKMEKLIQTEKIIVVAPEVFTAPVCQGDSVKFFTEYSTSTPPCRWYHAVEDILPYHVGNDFTTPGLLKSVTYFVSAEDANGCESERIPVRADVINYDSVTIAFHKGVFTSSYMEGNQWFYQGEMLPGETNQTLAPDKPGIYMVTVAIGSCITEATINYVITGYDWEDVEKNIQVFPNPFRDSFFIRFRKEISVELIDVLSSFGSRVNYLCQAGFDPASYEISTAHWPSGLYTLCFKIHDTLSFIQIIKH